MAGRLSQTARRVDILCVVAKACGSGEASENTCAAVERSLATPLPDWARLVIEVDVRLTWDDSLVAMHDATLDRTSTGSGTVRGTSLTRVRQLRTREGERIPLLEEIVEAAGDRQIVVELHDRGPQTAYSLLRTVARLGSGSRSRLMIASQHSRLVQDLRQLAPWLASAASAREALAEGRAGALTSRRFGAPGSHLDRPRTTPGPRRRDRALRAHRTSRWRRRLGLRGQRRRPGPSTAASPVASPRARTTWGERLRGKASRVSGYNAGSSSTSG